MVPHILMSKVDVALALQDYPPFASCARLIGVSGPSFQAQAFNQPQGCATYVVDLALTDLLQSIGTQWPAGLQQARSNHHALLAFLEEDLGDLWLKVSVSPRDVAASYLYEAFTDAGPSYVSVDDVALVSGPTVLPRTAQPVPQPSSSPASAWELNAFHVGQGMCSLAQEQNGSRGYLLDAGAGTPVRRQDYRSRVHPNGAPFVNELMAPHRVPALTTSLEAFISHPDSDHWRLLEWDAALLHQVQQIYLPTNTPALAFASPHVTAKVAACAGVRLQLSQRDALELIRSRPARPDRNADCLVARMRCGARQALLSGDYVYDRMLTDGDPVIAACPTTPIDAVVVPHHGDAASANAVPPPAHPQQSIAFFSAGTHAGYGHPTAASIHQHQAAAFQVIDRHTLWDIQEQRLMP